MLRPWPVLLLLLMMVTGCAPTHDVISKGPIQKRKYRSGWHVDLGARKSKEHRDPIAAARAVGPERMTFRSADTSLVMPPLELLVASTGPDPMLAVARNTLNTRSESIDHAPVAETGPLDDPRPENTVANDLEGPRPWNRMALVSGAFLVLSIVAIVATGGGGILPYLLTFSFITGLVGLLLAIKHKERGKGIAIAAIAFPIALLALVIAALDAAW